MIRRLVLGAGALVGVLVAIIAIEIAVMSRREFQPMEPEYTVDARVGPASATGDGGLIRLAVLGDSTVAGVGSPTMDEALPVLVAARVAETLSREVQVTGFGVSGARTASLVADQLPRLEASYDAIVLVIGSNDATHATFWPELRTSTETMLRRAASHGVPVILASTPRFAGTEIIPEPLRTLVDRYSGLLRAQQRAAVEAVPGTRLVNIADVAHRFRGVPEATSADGFHPSPIGYGFWADAIAPAVVDALRGG
jgi:lysophospholipase L1-like esterase